MSVKIKLKHSAVNGKAPLPTDLDNGELALNTNTASPAAYIKDSAGNIVKLAGAGAIGDDWTRTGTVLSPVNAGDAVNIGGTLPASPNIELKATGTATFAGDATINNVTVGLGKGSVATNTVVGRDALRTNTTGADNTAIGLYALRQNSTGLSNTAVGGSALVYNTTGTNNTAIGLNALGGNTTGKGNIGFGGFTSAGTYNPVFNATSEDNRIVMGSTAVTNAYIKVAWTVTSDARDKTNFAPVPHGLDFVKQLKPTQYKFRVDRDSEETSGPISYGFKAQDILALEGDNPVIIDNEDLDHLKYRGEALVPVLVNAIKEQQVLIDALTARLDAAGIA